MRTNFTAVKAALGIMTNYQDSVIGAWYDEAYTFCLEAGVPETYLKSAAAVGLLAKGTLDLWDNNSGAGKLSDYFKKRVLQARAVNEDAEV